jgi:glycosyltransferase involved in cell wall biosynthesis
MKVALVFNAVGGKAGGGGGARQMLELGAALTRQGHEVVVVCHNYEAGGDFEPPAGIEILAVRHAPVEPVVGARNQIERVWRGMKAVSKIVPSDVDVINAHEWPALHAGALASKRTGAPLVWTRNDEGYFENAVIPDDVIVRPQRGRTRLLLGGIGAADFFDARRAAEIVVLDRRNAAMVKRAYRRPAEIVRSGPAAHFFEPPPREEARRRLGVPDDAWLVVSVAILLPHRRFEDTIAAVAQMPEDVHGLVVGDDRHDPAYADSLTALVERLGVGDRVRVPRKSISDEQLRDVYSAADALVFPNWRQTWGLAALEAIAAGTPVVVSNGAGVHDVLEGRAGVEVVEPKRPELIAAALGRLRAADRSAVEPTREWIRTELTNDRYAERMVELYERALAKKS